MSLTILEWVMRTGHFPSRCPGASVKPKGVLRLRSVFAMRMRYSAQDDNVALSKTLDDATMAGGFKGGSN